VALRVLLALLVLLRSFVRSVAAGRATCDAAEHSVMGSVTGDADDDGAFNAPLGLRRGDARCECESLPACKLG
jgi:hypothetical protein